MEKIYKNKIYKLSIIPIVLISILLVGTAPISNAANTKSVYSIVLGKAGDGYGIGGSPIYVTLYLFWRGASTSVSVYVPGSDAYIAIASGVFGAYDDTRGEWVAFGYDTARRIHNYNGWLCDKTVHVTSAWNSFRIYEYSDKYIVVDWYHNSGYIQESGWFCGGIYNFALDAVAAGVAYK